MLALGFLGLGGLGLRKRKRADEIGLQYASILAAVVGATQRARSLSPNRRPGRCSRSASSASAASASQTQEGGRDRAAVRFDFGRRRRACRGRRRRCACDRRALTGRVKKETRQNLHLAVRRLHFPEMLWRISPGRSRRSRPAGSIPSRSARRWSPGLRSGQDSIHEIKHDGYRLIASKDASRVTLWTRHGTDLPIACRGSLRAVRSLPVESALIDGEAVVFRPDGQGDFAALRTKDGAWRAAFVAFESIDVEGEDFRKLPLEVRRARLEGLIGPDGAIVFSEALEVDGALMFAKACELGVEGVVSKRRGGVYLSGPCRNWLKIKNPAFARG